jgi:hypothetical protein
MRADFWKDESCKGLGIPWLESLLRARAVGARINRRVRRILSSDGATRPPRSDPAAGPEAGNVNPASLPGHDASRSDGAGGGAQPR